MFITGIREGMILSRPKGTFIYRQIDELIVYSIPRLSISRSGRSQDLAHVIHYQDGYMRLEEIVIRENSSSYMLRPRMTHRLSWLQHSKIVIWTDSAGAMFKLRVEEYGASRKLVSC